MAETPSSNDPGKAPAAAAAPASSFTGVRRERKTKLAIKIGDTVARSLITIGGLGTIAAVSLVFVFLLSKVGPLFKSGTAEPLRSAENPAEVVPPVAMGADDIIATITDEYKVMTTIVTGDGRLRTYRIDTGELLTELRPFGESKPTAWSFAAGQEAVAVGFADGSARFGTMTYGQTFLTAEESNVDLDALERGQRASFKGGVMQRTPANQLRLQTLKFEFGDPVQLLDQPIAFVDHSGDPDEFRALAVAKDGQAVVADIEMGFMGADVDVRDLELPVDGEIVFAGLNGLANNAWIVQADGRFLRMDVRSIRNMGLAEDFNATAGKAVTDVAFIIGKRTILIGDESGHLGAWYTYALGSGDTDVPRDNLRIKQGHSLRFNDSALSYIAVSDRTRMAALSFDDGTVSIVNVSNNSEIVTFETQQDGAADLVEITPKDNGLVVLKDGLLVPWQIDVEYHEVTAAALIFPIEYESRQDAETIWQSSSGDDAAEPKLGMWPVVFGSIKATFYAMLFGVPIALLAAIYTSEFMNPKVKATIKPAIEMMASLPSVVLGFLGGLVVAAWVEPRIMVVVLSVVTVPLSMLLCARLWQFVPRSIALRVGPWRLLLMALSIPLGVLFAVIGAIPVEYIFFTVEYVDATTGEILRDATGDLRITHDLKAWLAAGEQPIGDASFRFESSATGGWMFVLLPVAGILSMMINSTYITPHLRSWGMHMSERTMAMVDLVRFVVSCVLTFIVSVILGWLAGLLIGDLRTSNFVGWFILLLPAGAVVVRVALMLVPAFQAKGDDGLNVPRLSMLALASAAVAYLLALAAFSSLGDMGSPIGKYDQRNALIVGFMMGFAIIPIIYTIAEDALSSVPSHLRAASLGAGATPWQTAIRIILPTAMSGVFSAIMIGLGRAVGETMIVLMATGNTPVTSLNVYNGFRTLAATIAVELPEAPQDGTLYRTLFLCGLVLFVMTFALNTVAESIRQRFRKRAFEL